jgi:hypothetical protein
MLFPDNGKAPTGDRWFWSVGAGEWFLYRVHRRIIND